MSELFELSLLSFQTIPDYSKSPEFTGDSERDREAGDGPSKKSVLESGLQQ